ncbi:MAG TPA: nuclear transport factor 2 family protein [Acidobacteriaceae bacterium]|nr:nuclear transport factor 2 family protein [Acidobacteriaceae bacterium]
MKKFVWMAALGIAWCAAGVAQGQQAESAAPGQTKPPEVVQFQGYEDQWSTAVVNADQYTMENLLSPVYVGISASGDVTTRNQSIANLFDKSTAPVSMEQRVVSVRMFGDMAVVSGTYIMKWKTDGRMREERGIFTHVYAHERDRWDCVNAQRTPVVEVVPGSGKKKNQDKSSADEPFHIPLFYKGKQSSQPNTAQNTSIPQN